MDKSINPFFNSFCCIIIPLIVFVFWFFVWSSKSKPKQSPPPLNRSQTNSYGQQVHQAQSIHDRFKQVFPGSNSGPTGITISFNYSNGYDQFIKDAVAAHDIEGKQSPHIPFMTYWPTYRSFTKEQLLWYIYWRTEIRQSVYLKTDLSYIFVHIYEVLSLIEMKDPTVAIDRLMALCKAYEGDYPKLKHYVFDWAGDLIMTKIGVTDGIEWWMHRCLDDHYSPPDSVLNMVLHDLEKSNKISELPYSFWEQLNSYRPQNKFYKEFNQDHFIDHAYLKGIQAIDTYLHGLKTPKGILDSYVSERLYPQTKYAFSSAIVPSGWDKIINLGMAKRYKSDERLGIFLLSITKYTENILRKNHNVSAKLSGFTLDERFQEVLNRVFDIPPEPVKITLDTGRIQTLQAESNQVADLLKTAPDQKPLYSDIAQIRSMWNLLDSASRYLLLSVFVGEITHLNEVFSRKAISELINSINEQSLQFLGDKIISIESTNSPFIADDFKDEMELISHENLLDDLRPKTCEESTVFSSSPWEKFYKILSNEERDLIQEFSTAGSMSETEIAVFARERNHMGNLLIDSISEKAIKYIGNNPIFRESDQLVLDKEALEQLRSIIIDKGA